MTQYLKRQKVAEILRCTPANIDKIIENDTKMWPILTRVAEEITYIIERLKHKKIL